MDSTLNMNTSNHSVGNIKVLSLEGDLNATHSRDVETRINQMIMGGNKKLVVNLDKLNYISSAGLRVFLSANKLMKKKEGELRLRCLNNTVKEVFEISGFHMIFPIFQTEEEALSDF